MTVPTLAFFNNKGDVGKTTLAFHVAHMLAELGVRTLVVDCDPQANLSAAFLSDVELAQRWDDTQAVQTIYRSVKPVARRGNFELPVLYEANENLRLLVGDMALSAFEDQLSEAWINANDDNEDRYGRAFDLLTALWRTAQAAAKASSSQVILFDIGPNLGAINRSVLLGTDHIVAVLGADLFSLRGLQNIGPALKTWREGWTSRRGNKPFNDYTLPDGSMQMLGYVAMQHQERLNRPVAAYKQWVDRIPSEYRLHVLQSQSTPQDSPSIDSDPYALAQLRHYKSIIPMGQEARKPVFQLKSADGVSGSQTATVQRAHEDFDRLTRKILKAAQLDLL